MLLSLQQILTAVAKDKQLKSPDKWVEERLAHCEVHSDYYNFVHLKSHKNMWFGVYDSKFECKPFVLYREMTVAEDSMREFELYTFQSIEDPKFMEFIKEAYQSHFDSIKDLRLFYELTPVNFSVKFGDTVFSLGEYNDMDVDFDIETDLYHLEIKGSNLNWFAVHREQLELTILELRPYFTEVSDGVYTSNVVTVSKLGENIPFETLKKDNAWQVKWREKRRGGS